MKSNLIRAGGFSFALVLLFASVAAPVSAATQSPSSTTAFAQLLARSSRSSTYASYGRVSSSVSRKIKALDKDKVDELPIPILIGVSVANLTKNFGDPRDGGTRTHEGLDIMAPKDAYIVSPTEAVVTKVGTGGSSGNYVSTANPGGENFVFMHLDKFAAGIKSGDVLEPGDLIGYVGNTGNAAGGPTHLHFEVRDGRTATDPYPRLTHEFTLKERANALEKIVKDAKDEDEEVESIVANYRGTLIAARAAGIELSKELSEALGTLPGSTTTGGIARDLTLGSRGDDVVALQSLLITADTGPSAKALASAGATGYFGAVTQSALAEYQAAAGISPATGYFGPLTRARIVAGK